MPFTPIHLGVAAPLKAVCPGRFSLMVFAMAQVLMDLEPLIKLLVGHDELHALTHDLPGALLLALATVLVWHLLMAIKPRKLFQDFQRVHPGVIVFSALYGALSHLWLDVLYHADVAEATGFMALPGRGIGAEMIALWGSLLGLLVWGARYWLHQRRGGSGAV